RPGGEETRGERAGRAERAEAEPLVLPLLLLVGAGEPRLREDDVVQEPVDEEAFAARRRGRQDFALEIERACERAEHAVDRASFLGAAGEVHAAKKRLLAVARAGESLVDERRKERPQRDELMREAVDGAAPLHIALTVQPLQHARLKPLLDRLELGGETGAEI